MGFGRLGFFHLKSMTSEPLERPMQTGLGESTTLSSVLSLRDVLSGLFWIGFSTVAERVILDGNRRLKWMGLMQGMSNFYYSKLMRLLNLVHIQNQQLSSSFSFVVKAVELLSTSTISMRTRVASFGLFHCRVTSISMSQLSHGYADMNPHWCALSPLSSCWSPSILQRALGGKAWWKGTGGIPQ